MSRRAMMFILAVVLLAASGFVPERIRECRERHGLPSGLPFEELGPGEFAGTVLLGGARGVVVDILWMWASTLQQQGRFYELLDLNDWIAKLQPYFEDVWIYNGWNMAYNISHEAETLQDRWAWVRKGILYVEKGLRQNPRSYKLCEKLGQFHYYKFDPRYFPNEWRHYRKWYREERRIEPLHQAIAYYRQMNALVPPGLPTRMTKRHAVAHCYYRLALQAEEDAGEEGLSPVEKGRRMDLAGNYRRQCLAEWNQILREFPNDLIAISDWMPRLRRELGLDPAREEGGGTKHE
ncbi:MAG: hypothetical protein V1809_07030 [Planctomycetota bacterium]